jgi:hypothetical protein
MDYCNILFWDRLSQAVSRCRWGPELSSRGWGSRNKTYFPKRHARFCAGTKRTRLSRQNSGQNRCIRYFWDFRILHCQWLLMNIAFTIPRRKGPQLSRVIWLTSVHSGSGTSFAFLAFVNASQPSFSLRTSHSVRVPVAPVVLGFISSVVPV